MILVLPFCSKDVAQAVNLLEWCIQLGKCPKHDALLVADSDTQWSDCLKALDLAKDCFKSAELISTDKPFLGWPAAANAMFRTASIHLAGRGQPFFWCESDCIPLKAGWLDALEDEYKKCGRMFMGAHVRSEPPYPPVFVSGCSVYSHRAAEMLSPCCQGPGAWDVQCAAFMLPHSANTQLIQNFWGMKDLAPTFALSKTPYSSINTFTLSSLKPEAVVFHRNKDGSLIRLLRRRMFPGTERVQSLVVVVPFCNRDSSLALKNLQWMLELGGCPDFDCVLSVDSDTLGNPVARIKEAAKKVFKSVATTSYRCGSTAAWPHGANVAFRHTCLYMMDKGLPWLWLEPDAIPIKPDWLQTLLEEYENCGKLFMGPIVPVMGHMNGVGIYPSDTPNLIPQSLSYSLPAHIAWDSAMKSEMIHECHDAGSLIQHVWGIGADGNPHPFTGESPVFDQTWKLTKWVLPTAVLFHRNKDGSLIDCIKTFQKHHSQ